MTGMKNIVASAVLVLGLGLGLSVFAAPANAALKGKDALARIDETYAVEPAALAGLDEDDREDVVDLVGDINDKRRRARDRLERAEKARARGDMERVKDQEDGALESAEDAEADIARVERILGGRGTSTARVDLARVDLESDDADERRTRAQALKAGKGCEGDFPMERAKIVTTLPEGTQTLWFEDHGRVVALERKTETWEGPKHERLLWKDGRTYTLDVASGKTSSFAIRRRDMEPSLFAITPATDLEKSGAYTRQGTGTVAGTSCEMWRFKATTDGAYAMGCRHNGVEMSWIDYDASGTEQRRREVTELVVGEGIPQAFHDLAK